MDVPQYSALAGSISTFSVYVQTRWAGPEQVVPTVLLRNAVATILAVGNAATYFFREIRSLQRHSLVTVDGVAAFTPIAVPTAEVAVVE